MKTFVRISALVLGVGLLLSPFASGKQDYIVTKDLLSGFVPKYMKTLGHLKGQPNVKYLEIGAFEGVTIIWMLDHIFTHPTSRAVTIDNFFDKTENTFHHNLKSSGHTDKVTLLKGRSQRKLRELEPETFDVIYVDGSHVASDILSDAVQSWELLKVGGILMLDDYQYESGQPETPPKEPIDAFLKAFEPKLQIVHKDYQVHVKKLKH